LKKPRIFYGYWIIVCCFILTILMAGCGMLSFSFFVTSLESDLGWSRTQIMAAMTILLLATAFSAPFAGRLIQRYGGRAVVITGILFTCGGFVLLSQMSSLWHYYIAYALIGVGFATMGPVTVSFIMSLWFKRRRGTAIGIASMGAGVSGLIFTPLVAVYLIPNFGWSNSYLIFAIIIACLAIPLSLLVLRTRPEDLGLLPDGAAAPEPNSSNDNKPTAAEGLPLKAALATPAFWLIAIAVMLIHTHLGVMQNQVPHFQDLGFSQGVVASTISIIAVVSILSMLIFGWLCDRIPAKIASVIGTAILAIGIAILITVDAESPSWMLWLFAAMLGLGIGSWLPSLSILTSSSFGLVAYGVIFGIISFFQSVGAAAGPLFAGYLYDSMGTYFWAFIIILGIVVLAIPLILAVRRPASYPLPKT
jgi:MFS family permease